MKLTGRISRRPGNRKPASAMENADAVDRPYARLDQAAFTDAVALPVVTENIKTNDGLIHRLAASLI